jgi:hypothetical protein
VADPANGWVGGKAVFCTTCAAVIKWALDRSFVSQFESCAREKMLPNDFHTAGTIVLVCRLFLLMDNFFGSSETAYRQAV